MSKKKYLKVDTIAESCDLYNALNNGEDGLIDRALSIPIIKKGFKEHLEESCITEGKTEQTIEAGFMDWLMDNLSGVDVTVSFNIEHLYEYYNG